MLSTLTLYTVVLTLYIFCKYLRSHLQFPIPLKERIECYFVEAQEIGLYFIDFIVNYLEFILLHFASVIKKSFTKHMI